jgi:hypothetical protein
MIRSMVRLQLKTFEASELYRIGVASQNPECLARTTAAHQACQRNTRVPHRTPRVKLRR